jgi:two-component system nitrate/nitrite response regulator NarL
LETNIRVLIVDDHALFRQGLARLLDGEPGFKVVGQCSTVDEAAQAACTSRPHVVLLDVDLPGRAAGDFFELLSPDISCVTLLVTAVLNHGEIARLLRLGAKGAFSKSTDSSRLPSAIRQALAGEIWVDQVYLKGFIAAAATAPATAEIDAPAPSGREREVLALICCGLSNKQIADELSFSEPTVKAALQRLFRKFGVSNRAQLLAVSAGLTQPPR